MNNYKRIKLPYELNELEPIISFKTMYYHYNILHKNYEIKLNDTLLGTELNEDSFGLEKLMENLETGGHLGGHFMLFSLNWLFCAYNMKCSPDKAFREKGN